jgi:DNA-binding transcriptional ArsR family regulator
VELLPSTRCSYIIELETSSITVEQAVYRVEVDWALAYEVLVSLKAYVNRREHKTLELGAGWARGVRRQLRPELAAELASADALADVHVPDLLVWQCPGNRDVAGYLRWLGVLAVGELYERVAPYGLEGRASLPRDLSAVRDRYVRLLEAWDEQYFRLVDPAILRGLAADAAAKRALVGAMAPDALVEAATCGVHFVPQPGPELVLLVPQYHFRPWNVFQDCRGLRVIQYPADALPAVPGEPPPGLLRLTRALSDESRLRILRFLATGPRSFTDVVQFMGLAKSTVHHHMVVLRAAGLVRVHDTGEKVTSSYSLRPGAVDRLRDMLHAYLPQG